MTKVNRRSRFCCYRCYMAAELRRRARGKSQGSPGRHDMNTDRNRYDVSERIDVTDPVAVSAEVKRIFFALYPGASAEHIERAFRDLDALYRGKYPGYHACDTAYHDM